MNQAAQEIKSSGLDFGCQIQPFAQEIAELAAHPLGLENRYTRKSGEMSV